MNVFIVTGASSGIGQATAEAIAARGIKVLAVARNSDRLQQLHEKYPKYIHPVVADLSMNVGVETVLNATASVSHISGVVHAAGSSVPLASYQKLQTKENELQYHFSIHVEAPIALNTGLGEKLNGSRVVFIDSYSADNPRVGWAGYSIIKAAARMAAKAAAAELTKSIVLRVLPGGVRTPLIAVLLSPEQQNETAIAFRKLNQAGKIVEPQVIGQYLCELLIDASNESLESREVWEFEN